MQILMSTYNVLPELFENVTTQLIGGLQIEDEEELKQGTEDCEKRT